MPKIYKAMITQLWFTLTNHNIQHNAFKYLTYHLKNLIILIIINNNNNINNNNSNNNTRVIIIYILYLMLTKVKHKKQIQYSIIYFYIMTLHMPYKA